MYDGVLHLHLNLDEYDAILALNHVDDVVHFSRKLMARRVSWQGYSWPTLYAITEAYDGTCRHCRKRRPII